MCNKDGGQCVIRMVGQCAIRMVGQRVIDLPLVSCTMEYNLVSLRSMEALLCYEKSHKSLSQLVE